MQSSHTSHLFHDFFYRSVNPCQIINAVNVVYLHDRQCVRERIPLGALLRPLLFGAWQVGSWAKLVPAFGARINCNS